MTNEKGHFVQVTNQNYRKVIGDYERLIGQKFKPRNLELLYLVASDWSLHGETQDTWFRNNHSQNREDWLTYTEDELKEKVGELDNLEWPDQFLEIMAVFRDENTERVYFDPLEHILLQNDIQG